MPDIDANRTQGREDLRKLVHIAFSLGALLTPWIGRAGGLALAVLGLFHNIFVLPRYAFGRRLLRQGQDRGDAGLICYPLAIAIAYALAPPMIAAGVWLILGFGDGLASIVGRRARARLPWNERKTWLGALAFVVSAALAAWLVLPLGVAVSGALAGAIVESLPWRRDDNLPIALAAGVVMHAVACGW